MPKTHFQGVPGSGEQNAASVANSKAGSEGGEEDEEEEEAIGLKKGFKTIEIDNIQVRQQADPFEDI